MAGRPKTMLKKVSSLSMRALALWNDIRRLTPEQYREEPYLRGEAAEGWRQASSGIATGYHGLNDLGKLLAVKAKIIVEKDQQIEIDEESATLTEWSAEYGVPEQVILDRVRCGWDWETAVTKPAEADELRPEESVPEAEVEG
jgi:hypothetical protein